MLAEQLHELISACFTGIWIESHEQHEAIAEIRQMCVENEWLFSTWDIDQGLSSIASGEGNDASDPITAIQSFREISHQADTSVMVMSNLHKFVNSVEVIQVLQSQLIAGKQNRAIVIAISPTSLIPPELEKLFVVIEHALPSRAQLESILREIANEEGELPNENDFEKVLDAAAGLTRLEAENAFSLGLVRSGCVEANAIWELKSGMLKKSGLLQLHSGNEDFATLGGLNSLKAFAKRSLLRPGNQNQKAMPRGILLLGVPGTGKSAFAKALGNETGRPTITLDIGALMGSLVGQTESNVRRALKIADAMEPCVLFIDELDKALGGISGSGQNDSGVSSRLFGTLLSWMNDHNSNVYLVATCNDISKLPPELSRAERFDAIMFLDLPKRKQKDLIWQQYQGYYELNSAQEVPNDESWTGAEIKACCRLSSLLDIPLKQAASNIVPVSVTAAESVSQLRSWASDRCIDAEDGGIYQAKPSDQPRRRKVKSNPSLN